MNKRIFKKEGEELQEYFRFQRKHGVVPAKKGKGSFKRNRKHKNKEEE
jgi:stalled ribosome alternative rescue factor ArfA